MQKETVTIRLHEAAEMFDGELFVGFGRINDQISGQYDIGLTFSSPTHPQQSFAMLIGDAVRYAPKGHPELFEARLTKLADCDELENFEDNEVAKATIHVTRISDSSVIAAIKARKDWQNGN